ncbi:MAG: hypothetical protein ABIJ57_13820 [Pseudomonadota bacterium]
MKIKVAITERYGRYGRERIALREIRATMPFEMFGFTFAAHPVVNPDGTFRDPKKCGWVVSEASSGAVAAYGDTRRGVIEYAKSRIESIGSDRVRETIEHQIGLQKKARGMQ